MESISNAGIEQCKGGVQREDEQMNYREITMRMLCHVYIASAQLHWTGAIGSAL